jgi:serpin B
MLVFLPKKDIKTDDFIKDFNVELFNNTINNFSIEEDLIVQIPKFKIEYGTKLLNNQLKQMGMNIPFSSQADFSRIREGLMISRVLHKSFIEVNEKGSEAAAATIVEIQETIAMEPEVFRADRPFIFMIYDEISKTILFLGKNT